LKSVVFVMVVPVFLSIQIKAVGPRKVKASKAAVFATQVQLCDTLLVTVSTHSAP
jgi:hypothetical protein